MFSKAYCRRCDSNILNGERHKVWCPLLKEDTTVTIDPADIFMETPTFTILKSGKAIPTKDVVKETVHCKDCGKIRSDSRQTFVDGFCNRCWLKLHPMPPEQIPVMDSCRFEGSSFLVSADYIHSSNEGMGTLVLHLKNSRKLTYLNVPVGIWQEFTTDESAGKFYNTRIKGTFLQQLDEPNSGREREESKTVLV